MQKLRVFSKSKEAKDTKDSNDSYDRPSTPKLRDFSFTSASLSPSSPTIVTHESTGKLSPELAPIVSLLSAQSHRKYNEGVFMLLKDLDSDGNPAERKWLEVYGIMIGNELAYWNSDQLETNGSIVLGDSKPSYINFSDGSFKSCLKLPSANNSIDNVIVLSTTLKNRFLLQFSSDDDFQSWSCAFRLSTFEYKTLQEAYTATLLITRGALLSDIKVILAEKKFNYEDWTSVRFGAGMPWKRCFAVIEPSKKTRKGFKNGCVYFYENDKKKKSLMAKITNISSVYALYPRSYTVIDKSTMIKLEGAIQFDQKESSKSCSIFLMPEQHTSVPGYDTLIRFLIPLMDSFNLYGRPTRLIADKTNPNSLLFGLPVLPKVHYLELKDLESIFKNKNSFDWNQEEWMSNIKEVLRIKMSNGNYQGCGSSDGINGAVDLLNSSKDMADGKINFFINKPEAQRYLESSPHARSLHVLSSEENSVRTESPLVSEIKHQNNSRDRNINILIDKEDSLYSNSNLSPEKSVSSTPDQNVSFSKNSPSPQVVNIYQKYSQIPDNEKLSNDRNVMSSAENLNPPEDILRQRFAKKTSTLDDLYPSNTYSDFEDEDNGSGEDGENDQGSDDDYDEDNDNTGFDFVAPKDKNQRILSPFTEFNNDFQKVMQLNGSASNRNHIPSNEHRVYGNRQNQQNGTNPLNVKKQRSPKKFNSGKADNSQENTFYPSEQPFDESRKMQGLNSNSGRYVSTPTNTPSRIDFGDPKNMSLNRSSSSDNIIPQKVSYDSNNDSLFAPVSNPYSSPQTPSDQQNPPHIQPMKHQHQHRGYKEPVNSNNRGDMSANLSNANQPWGQPSHSPQNYNANQPPKPPIHQSYGQNSPLNQNFNRPPAQKGPNYANSPELVPPHQYQSQGSHSKGRNNSNPQLKLNTDYKEMKNNSHPLNNPNSPSFGVYGPMKLPSPVINKHPGNEQRQFSRNQNGGEIRPNVAAMPQGYNPYPSDQQQGYYNNRPPQGGMQNPPVSSSHYHQPHHKQNVHNMPSSGNYPPQYGQQQMPPSFMPQNFHPSQQQYPPQQPMYPPAGKPMRMRGPPPPSSSGSQIKASKSFKHDPYALAKAPNRN